MDVGVSIFAEPRRTAARLRVSRRPLTWLGGLLLLVGVTTTAVPLVSPQAAGVAAGWLLWLAGAATLAVSLLVGDRRAFVASLLASLAAVSVGVVLMAHPLVGRAGVLVAAVLLLHGGAELALAVQLRPLRVWSWMLGSAAASFLAAVAVIAAVGGSPQGIVWGLAAAVAASGAALLAMARRSARRGYSAARTSVRRSRPGSDSLGPEPAGRSASTPST